MTGGRSFPDFSGEKSGLVSRQAPWNPRGDGEEGHRAIAVVNRVTLFAERTESMIDGRMRFRRRAEILALYFPHGIEVFPCSRAQSHSLFHQQSAVLVDYIHRLRGGCPGFSVQADHLLQNRDGGFIRG